MSKRQTNWAAVGVLVLLWGLFFWRVLTPITADKASFTQGDFSGQFVAFGAYQYERFVAGEVPLWNPYNNGGLPFIADTQAATFYAPRLLTIGLARLAGGWSYHALELEAIFHVLGYTLAMYALVRRLTGSVLGGMMAAVIGGYGGYVSGYPPLQLALLEAGVWLPLVILGVHEAVGGQRNDYLKLALAGFALGVSWTAGHPQTSFFLTWLAVAYLIFRLWNVGRLSARGVAVSVVGLGVVTFGTTAVTFLPGVEYLAATARSGMGYASKTNGFPLVDVVQFVLPGVVSLFSPLYIGVTGFLVVVAGMRGASREMRFWLGVAAFGLVWGFGANTALFPALYNVMPGLRFFRGQERAAFLVANGLAIASGYAIARYTAADADKARRRMTRVMWTAGVVFGAVVVLWLGWRERYGPIMGPLTLSTAVIVVMWALVRWQAKRPVALRMAVIGLLVFELFSVNMDADSNYDDVPPSEQITMDVPPLVEPVVPGPDEVLRVDGFRGLTDNYASLYSVYDVRGISPLFLEGLYAVQLPPFASAANFETNPTLWELGAVEYVYSGFEALPVESEVITSGADRFGPVWLHALADPRPFAQVVYAADVVDSDEFARALLADPAYAPRESVILNQEPTAPLPDMPGAGQATVTTFEPERFIVKIETDKNAVVTLAHPDYSGWQATLDGERIDILRAYGGWSAVSVPAGEHTLEMVYEPLTYRVGAIISAVTWLLVGGLWVWIGVEGQRNNANDR